MSNKIAFGWIKIRYASISVRCHLELVTQISAVYKDANSDLSERNCWPNRPDV